MFGVSLLKADLWNYFVKSVVSAVDWLALRAAATKQLYEKNRACLNSRCLGISQQAKHFKITHQFCPMKKPYLLYLTVVKTILFFSDRENKALLNRLFLNFAEAVKTAHHMTNIQTAGPVYSAFPRSFASSFFCSSNHRPGKQAGCVLESSCKQNPQFRKYRNCCSRWSFIVNGGRYTLKQIRFINQSHVYSIQYE